MGSLTPGALACGWYDLPTDAGVLPPAPPLDPATAEVLRRAMQRTLSEGFPPDAQGWKPIGHGVNQYGRRRGGG